MRGLSTVAAFVVFLTAFAVVMFSVFYFYGVLREAALRGVQTIYASTVQDRPVEFYMSGGVCGIGGGPYFYYVVLRDYEEVHSGGSLVCPPGPGFYKYVGVERTGYLGYSFVYVGPAVLQLQSNISEVLVNRVGDVFSFDLYLHVYNNSTGWLPSGYAAELVYDSTLLSCTPASFAAPDAVVSPAALRVYRLGAVRCTVNSRLSATTIRAVVRQSYGSHSWAAEIPVVVRVINASAACCGAGGGGGGGACGISPLSGARLSGFNELNGWIAAWGGNSSNIVVAVRPGILVPDSTGTGTGQYYVEVTADVAELSISGTTQTVTVTGSMPDFIQAIEIRAGPYVVYKDGTPTAINLPPGTYNLTVYVRAKSNAAPGQTSSLTLTCGSSSASLTFRVPQWSQWGIKVDVYSGTNFDTFRGSWSVGSIYFWLTDRGSPSLPSQGPYFTLSPLTNKAPKWAAALLNPSATQWTSWSLRYSGKLYLPWSSFRVGVWHDDGVRVTVCGVRVVDSWITTSPRFDSNSVSCPTAGVNDVTVEYFEGAGEAVLIFVVGPTTSNEAYIPTIDGAWYCNNFRWSGAQAGTCSSTWTFVPAASGVPYFVVDGYTPGGSDGVGAPAP